MKQRLSDLLEKSLKIKQNKHSELKNMKHNRADYFNVLSDPSKEKLTEGNDFDKASVESDRTPVPSYIRNLKETDSKNNTPNRD